MPSYNHFQVHLYNIAMPATNPPAIAPTTPGTFATAAPVCAGAEADDATDEVREAEVEKDEDTDALEDCATEDEPIIMIEPDWETEPRAPERDAEPDGTAEPERVGKSEMIADGLRDAMNVGVTIVVGTALLSVGTASVRVGMTRPLWPK